MECIINNNVAWLLERCKNPVFWDFLSAKFAEIVQSEQQAINVACWHCRVDAITDFDTRTSIASQFDEVFRQPYAEFIRRSPVSQE